MNEFLVIKFSIRFIYNYEISYHMGSIGDFNKLNINYMIKFIKKNIKNFIEE